MRVLRYLIIVAALGAAVAIAVQSTQEALDERDAARSSSSPFGPPATASAGASQPQRPATAASHPTAASGEQAVAVVEPAPSVGELPPDLEIRIEEELRSWTFAEEGASVAIDFLLAAEPSPQSRRVAQWLLARTLVSTTDDARRVPERLHEVELKNGSILHARSLTEENDAVALTTMTGIDAKLAAHKVERVRAIDRASYLRRTGDEFRERIERLDRTRPSELETVLEETLRRGQIELARDLFHDWIDAGGPARLAERFSRRKAPGLHRAAALLTEETTPPTIVATSATAPALGNDPLTTLEDLGKNIDGAYQALARKTLDRDELQSWVQRVSKWEEWLERRLVKYPGRDSKATVDDIRQRLQHLRLDLLKKSGF